MPKTEVEFIVSGGTGRVPKSFLKRAFFEIKRELMLSKQLSAKRRKLLNAASSLQLVFVNMPQIRRLNREYRGKDKVTDVLSFAPNEPGSLGELVLSMDVLKRQAIEHDMKFQDELGYMVLHGVLHLLGYDHENSEASARTMFRLQDKIFDAVRRRW